MCHLVLKGGERGNAHSIAQEVLSASSLILAQRSVRSTREDHSDHLNSPLWEALCSSVFIVQVTPSSISEVWRPPLREELEFYRAQI